MTRAHWTRRGEDFLVRHYGKMPQREIAAKLKMEAVQVRRWALWLGLTSPNASKPLPPGYHDQILEDYARMSLTQVAQKHGISRELAWSRIRKARTKR